MPHSQASAQRMESGLPPRPTPVRKRTLLHPNSSSFLEGCWKAPQAQASSLKPGHQVEGHFHSAAPGGKSHPSSPPLAQGIGPAARSPGLDSGSDDIQPAASKLPRAANGSPTGHPELRRLSRRASSRGLLRPQRAGPSLGPGFLRHACQATQG